jgi:hypothetical protein
MDEGNTWGRALQGQAFDEPLQGRGHRAVTVIGPGGPHQPGEAVVAIVLQPTLQRAEGNARLLCKLTEQHARLKIGLEQRKTGVRLHSLILAERG